MGASPGLHYNKIRKSANSQKFYTSQEYLKIYSMG